MDKFGIIGWPVGHSLSPKLFRAAYHGEFSYDLIGKPVFEECWNAFLNGEYRAVNVTAPYKEDAFRRSDTADEYVRRIGAANIIVRNDGGLTAHNSDFLGVKHILESLDGIRTACVIGFGGAGKAALAAAGECGLNTSLRRHDELSAGIRADVVIYTLPRYADGADRIRCRHLIEANYKDPCLGGLDGITDNYIPGLKWLLEQAIWGYGLMTGKKPDEKALAAALDI